MLAGCNKKKEKNVDLNGAACMLQPLWKRSSLHLGSSLGPLIISGEGGPGEGRPGEGEAWGGGGLGRGRPGEGRPGEGEAWGRGGLGRGRPGEGGPGERPSCLTWIHLNWEHGNGCKD